MFAVCSYHISSNYSGEEHFVHKRHVKEEFLTKQGHSFEMRLNIMVKSLVEIHADLLPF